MAELKYLIDIPREIHKDNVKEIINKYCALLSSVPIEVPKQRSAYDFLRALKRTNIAFGPYPDVSLFEAANRIMSDLVVLFGVQQLLVKQFDGVTFTHFNVQLGNEANKPHDVIASHGDYQLHGEAFNVAESFFYLKKRASLSKLLQNDAKEKRFVVLLYNDDATPRTFNREGNVFYEPVVIRL